MRRKTGAGRRRARPQAISGVSEGGEGFFGDHVRSAVHMYSLPCGGLDFRGSGVSGCLTHSGSFGYS